MYRALALAKNYKVNVDDLIFVELIDRMVWSVRYKFFCKHPVNHVSNQSTIIIRQFCPGQQFMDSIDGV